MSPVLRFLADESCDYGVVRALRENGFDVLAISDTTTRSLDRDLINLAYQENRILITEDKDFGWLVYVTKADSAGVILIRFPGNVRSKLVEAITKLVIEKGEELPGAFVVIQPGYIRIGGHETLSIE
jgi:predicted nuclease of predicted toxin-antitoxin system